MFFDDILLNVFLDLILSDELHVFCWSFEFFIADPLVSFRPYCYILFLLNVGV